MPIYIAALFSLAIIILSGAFENIWGKYVKRWKAVLFLFALGAIMLIPQKNFFSINTVFYFLCALALSIYILFKLRTKAQITEIILIAILIGMVMEITKLFIIYNYYWIADKYIYYIIGVESGILSAVFNERYEGVFLVSCMSPVICESIDLVKIYLEDGGIYYAFIAINNQKFCLVCSLLIALYLIPVKFRKTKDCIQAKEF